jgi:hypothetical protein
VRLAESFRGRQPDARSRPHCTRALTFAEPGESGRSMWSAVCGRGAAAGRVTAQRRSKMGLVLWTVGLKCPFF